MGISFLLHESLVYYFLQIGESYGYLWIQLIFCADLDLALCAGDKAWLSSRQACNKLCRICSQHSLEHLFQRGRKEHFDFNNSINCQVLCQSSRKEERYSTIYKLKRVWFLLRALQRFRLLLMIRNTCSHNRVCCKSLNRVSVTYWKNIFIYIKQDIIVSYSALFCGGAWWQYLRPSETAGTKNKVRTWMPLERMWLWVPSSHSHVSSCFMDHWDGKKANTLET